MAEPSPPSLRYRLNITLFALLMIALTFWFQRHLQVYVTQILLLGGTMTLWAFLQLAQSWLKLGWEADAKDTAKTILGQARGTEYLVTTAVLLAVLWFTTSSLYFTCDSGGASDYRIEARSADGALLPTTAVNASHRIAGQPYFLRMRSQEVEFRLLEPRGFLPLSAALRPGERLDIKVPGSFKPKQFHVLRLVPGANAYSNLSEYDDYPSTFYEIKISRGSDTVTFRDFRHQSLYVGAAGDDIRWLLGRQEPGQSLQSLVDLLRAQHVPGGISPQLIKSAESNRGVFETFEFAAGDRITLEVSRRRGGGSQPLVKMTVELTDKDLPVRPVLVEFQ